MAGNVSVGASLNPHPSAAAVMEAPMVEIDRLSLWYGDKQALRGGDGLPEVDPLPEVHLRERRLRPADPGRPQPERPRGDRRAEPPGCRALGRGPGPARRLSARALGRP